MKKDEISVGGLYLAKISSKIVTVRVDAIRETKGRNSTTTVGTSRRINATTAYDVTNLSTGRKTTFLSAAKFRGPAKVDPDGKTHIQNSEGNFRPLGTPDPIPTITGLHVGPLGGLTHEEPTDPNPDGCPDCCEYEYGEPCGSCGHITEKPEEGEQRSDPTSTAKGAAVAADSEVATVVTRPTSALGATAPVATTTNFSAKIASARQGRAPGTPVAGMVPNAEQEAILTIATELGLNVVALRDNDGQIVLVIVAGAGTGKTAVLKMLENIFCGRVQYTAYNKSLVEDSRPKFLKAGVATTHALAWRAVGKRYAHRMQSGRIKSWQVAQVLGITDTHVALDGPVLDRDGIEWKDAAEAAGYNDAYNPAPDGWNPKVVKRLKADFLAGQVLTALDKFMTSADREVGEHHFHYIDNIDPVRDGKRTWDNNNTVRRYLLPFAHAAWCDLSSLDGTLPFKHDVYVKMWQLGEGDDRPIIPADYILLDEYQDTAPVFLDVLKQQRHSMLVMVGDDNQRIYEWRGAVNASDEFPDAPRRLLSQSYRFGQVVADVANSVLATLDEPTDLVMRGNPDLPSRVAEVDEPRCYLYRTNAGALGRVMNAVAAGKRPHLIGKVDDIIAWCRTAEDLQAKRGTNHRELGCFDSWQEVQEYSKTDEGADLKLMVKLVDTFGARKIIDALNNMPKEEDADLVVSTAHKSKGREWDTVRLGQDFPLAYRMGDSDRRLLYVAATRAKLTLDISECPPFCGGKERDGGEDGNGESRHVPGLDITYTAPMPTEEEQAAWLEGKQRPHPTSVQSAVVTPTVTTSAPTTVPAPTTTKPTYKWCTHSGEWCVRGPANTAIGARVTVTRKDGSTSEVTIRSVVVRYEDAWVYGT